MPKPNTDYALEKLRTTVRGSTVSLAQMRKEKREAEERLVAITENIENFKKQLQEVYNAIDILVGRNYEQVSETPVGAPVEIMCEFCGHRDAEPCLSETEASNCENTLP